MRRLLAVAVLVVGTTMLSSSQQSGVPIAISERPGGDFVQASVADGSGGIWITGRTEKGLAVTPDAMQQLPPGGGDVFVSHIGADGRLLYATYLGGNSIEESNGIARDAAGNLYITGTTGSFDFPNTTGAVHPATTGRDVFVTKLDPTGRRILYSTYFGGASIEEAAGIAVDSQGYAHVVGSTSGHGFPVTWGRCLDLWVSAFYVRLSPDGTTLVSATCLDDARAAAIALDAAGDAHVVGRAGKKYSPLMGTRILKTTFPAGAASQAFLAKFSGSGDSIESSTYLGGSRDDWAHDVAVTSRGIYVGGGGTSVDYEGAPRSPSAAGNWTGWITKVRLDEAAILGTALIDGDGTDDIQSLDVDASEVVHLTGWTNSTNLPVQPGAAQPSSGGGLDAFYATIWAPTNTIADLTYLSYLGGPRDDRAFMLSLDGGGGAWIGGYTIETGFPLVKAVLISPSPSLVARFGQPRPVPQAGNGDIVLHARDASATVGAWEYPSDPSAASGARAWNRDAGAFKVTEPAASPANYFELTFQASAGVDYHLWLRMKADNDHWANDSVWVQFSDSVDAGGSPIWQTGTASAASVSLEDCTNCGEQGWGWNDNGYASPAVPVRFASTGSHTIRIQQREDGISIDQIVLSSGQWALTAPGASRYDAMILAKTVEPPPPPPSDAREIVMYAASERLPVGERAWVRVDDATAAGGARLLNPDSGQAKASSPSASAGDYFEVRFTAEAGVPYRLWVRGKATGDFYGNDSVFVQFSDSVDANGSAIYRTGTNSATIVILEECSGCGLQGWGWTDNAYGAAGPPIYFASSGPQTIRVLRREDGLAIDQIVLSAGRFFNSAPGAAKNDQTIVPK